MSIEESYNIWAHQYDSNDNKTRDLDKEATIKCLSKLKFKRVVELGCGSGKNTEWLIKRAEKVIGIDFSEAMLSKAGLKINSDKALFKKIDLNDNWGIPHDYTDLVTCSLTLEHIKELDPVFRQTFQILKPNATLFVSELHPFKQYTGSKAKFESEQGLVEPEVFIHHVSEYLDLAMVNGFKLIELREWFDKQNTEEIPRLISFLFEKVKKQHS